MIPPRTESPEPDPRFPSGPWTGYFLQPARPPASAPVGSAPINEWQRRLRALAAKILAKGMGLPAEESQARVAGLFDAVFPEVWGPTESARDAPGSDRPIPLPVWEDLWRCYAVSRLGGPSPAERVLGIPANTLRQWINDRESR